MRINELMSTDVISVHPEETLKHVAAILLEHRISGLPVCDTDGRVLGVVSEADILHKEQGFNPSLGILGRLVDATDGERARILARTAGEAMTTPAVVIAPTATVAQAARVMLERRVNRLPVVLDGRLLGIVTRADLVRAFHRSDEEIEHELRDDVLRRTLWMSPHAIEIRVADGDVTLSGTTSTRSKAELIETFARRVPGVVDVRSELSWSVDDGARRHSLPTS